MLINAFLWTCLKQRKNNKEEEGKMWLFAVERRKIYSEQVKLEIVLNEMEKMCIKIFCCCN